MPAPANDGYLVGFEDGPMASKGNVATLAGPDVGRFMVPREQFGWPLPDRLGVFVRGDGAVALWDADGELPPEHRQADSMVYAKVGESQLTDEQVARMSHVVRGAAYMLESS